MTVTQFITATDLEQMSSDIRFELIQGVPYEVSPSAYRSAQVVSFVGNALFNFVQRAKLGQVTFAEAGFLLERSPDSVVAPDIAFVCKDRIPVPIPERGFFPGGPDLAIEVISPTDEPANIRRKQALYERASVPLVWWIDPGKQTAIVQRPGHANRHLAIDEILDGADIVPGFSIALSDVFAI